MSHTALVIQALLFLLAVVLLALAGLGVAAGRVSLALLGAAAVVLALGVPAITAAF
jgi:hypothetical protein